MKLPTRWLVWGGVAIVALLAIGIVRGIQPIADDTVPSARPATPSDETTDETTLARGATQAAIGVTDEDVDRVFDQMLAMLEELASDEQSEEQGEEGGPSESTMEWGDEQEWGEEQADATGEIAEEGSNESGDAGPPETIVNDFLYALQSMNIDKMLSMARGQAHTKISELKQQSLPPEAAAMFSMIEVTNGRLVGDNEYRFNLSMPMESESPEIVMRRDSGAWWIDEIIDN